MKLLNDLTFTYAYLIENYGFLTLKALDGGRLFSTPRGVFLADNFWSTELSH